MNCINLQNISKKYKNFYAVKNIDLSLSMTENTVIVGKSGAGKSTLLNMINSLIECSEGNLEFPDNFKSATVFQEPRLLPWLTLEQNAKFWGEDIGELFKEFNIDQFKDLYPHEASGGMAAKVSLIRALACDANYLLLDEPFVALDYFTRLNLQQKLLFGSKKIGMLFITHNIEEAIFLGHRILVVDNGQITQEFKNETPVNERSYRMFCGDLFNKLLDSIQFKE